MDGHSCQYPTLDYKFSCSYNSVLRGNGSHIKASHNITHTDSLAMMHSGLVTVKIPTQIIIPLLWCVLATCSVKALLCITHFHAPAEVCSGLVSCYVKALLLVTYSHASLVVCSGLVTFYSEALQLVSHAAAVVHSAHH